METMSHLEAVKAMIKTNRYFGKPTAAIVERDGGFVVVSVTWAKANKVPHEIAW